MQQREYGTGCLQWLLAMCGLALGLGLLMFAIHLILDGVFR